MFKTHFIQCWLLGSLSAILGGVCSSALAQNLHAQEPLAQCQEFMQDEKGLRVYDGRKDLTEQDLAALEATTAQLAAKWRDRDPKHYTDIVDSICGTLACLDFHSSRQTALAEKRFAASLKNPDQMPLEDVADLTYTLAHLDERLKREQQPALRKMRVTQWTYVFARMDKETDPNFNVNDAPMSLHVFLLNPDPAESKAYEQLYKRNEEKKVYFNHQYWLTSKRYQYVSMALGHFKAAFPTPKDAQELRSLLAKTQLTAEFKAQINDVVYANAQRNEAVRAYKQNTTPRK